MIEVASGTALGQAIDRAQAAIEADAFDAAEARFEDALAALDDNEDAERLRRLIWGDHVGALLNRNQPTRAARAATSYLADARTRGDRLAQYELQLLAAEAQASLGDWSHCEESLRSLTTFAPELLGTFQPRIERLRGLAAAEEGKWSSAYELLKCAHERFRAAGDTDGERVIVKDLQRLALTVGDPSILDDIVASEPEGTHEQLVYARALRRDARFESAARVLETLLRTDLEPAWRFHVLHELVLLKQILGDQQAIERLLPFLREAATLTADPEQARATVEQLERWRSEGFTTSTVHGYESELHRARAYIQTGRLQDAENLLRELRSEATSPRRVTYWMVAVGELEFSLSAASAGDEAREHADQAVAYLARAAEMAWRTSMPQVYAGAVRLLGRAHAVLRRDFAAGRKQWVHASRAEELIAHRLESDESRTRYLELLPSMSDELIDATAGDGDAENMAVQAVNLEEARGAAILSLILPTEVARVRELPLPTDPGACWRWSQKLSEQLPRDLAVWSLHCTPGYLVQTILGRAILRVARWKIDRAELIDAVDALKSVMRDRNLVQASVQGGGPDPFTQQIAMLSDKLNPKRVLKGLPARIERLAVVAGGALSEIPFAALPDGENTAGYLVERFALSDLPCLSAFVPMRQRALAARGDAGILVRPPAEGLLEGERLEEERDDVLLELSGEAATPRGVAGVLAGGRQALVQFDCHGRFSEKEALDSWLQLAPDGKDDGRLTARRLESIDLDRCGTLILGACESGMAKRVGRDERTGFVRAGLAAGAASVVAARWVAADVAASQILCAFRASLRYLPKDRALQQAQVAYLALARSGGLDGRLPRPFHPAHWACWTLYGDAGIQTGAGWLRRWARRRLAERQEAS